MKKKEPCLKAFALFFEREAWEALYHRYYERESSKIYHNHVDFYLQTHPRDDPFLVYEIPDWRKAEIYAEQQMPQAINSFVDDLNVKKLAIKTTDEKWIQHIMEYLQRIPRNREL